MMIEDIATDQRARGQGIASYLVQCMIQWADSWTEACAGVFSFAWTTDQGCHLAGVLERAGMHMRSEVHDFWLADSESKGYKCPVCGTPCLGAARIYVMGMGARR